MKKMKRAQVPNGKTPPLSGELPVPIAPVESDEPPERADLLQKSLHDLIIPGQS
jgi:hypothetical protein